ncbi:hypothetical protein C8P68_106361 [Mucilaginibacter yixingensis]|uniref:Lipoprotein n=1 Tax=Mucilaginibacter yixingensis TaxID=1295612 RepID=A0A2T5J7U3_9SPHI|nr:hypothetical protein [Mucilaginibacter yixingensis]PTQ95146.1 hypothetical protein C8P68_106361 [Mucilaginibacter yixingensis]
MKKFLFLLLLPILLIACKGNGQHQETTDTHSQKTIGRSKTDNPLVKEFKPLIKGSWISKTYVDELIKTRSVFSATQKLDEISGMVIDPSFIKADTLPVVLGLNNIEGGAASLRFRAGTHPHSIKFHILLTESDKSDKGELSYEIKGADTLLVLYYQNSNGKSSTARYMRTKPGNGLSDALTYTINRSVFSGHYTYIDSLGHATKITFNSNGTINGFGKNKIYEASTIFNNEPATNIDDFQIGSDQNNAEYLPYLFVGDTLKIYERRLSADSTILIRGPLRYKLIRQR